MTTSRPTAPAVEELADKNYLRGRYPRRVIVLSSQRDSRALRSAITHASEYENPSGEAVVSYSTGSQEGWIWTEEFRTAREQPNTFLVLEDGSVLQRPITEIESDLKLIAAQGGGLSFAHQSNSLFRQLGAGFCILADDSLETLLSHLKVSRGLLEMHLLYPLNHDAYLGAAQGAAKDLVAGGTPVVEVSKRMGISRATMHRWMRSWRGES